MPRTLSTSYHIPPVWYTCVFSLYSTAENCLLSSYMKYIAPWFSFRNYYGFCFFTNKKRQKPWFYKVSDANQTGDERIELPPKVLETPIIPFDQSPIIGCVRKTHVLLYSFIDICQELNFANCRKKFIKRL